MVFYAFDMYFSSNHIAFRYYSITFRNSLWDTILSFNVYEQIVIKLYFMGVIIS